MAAVDRTGEAPARPPTPETDFIPRPIPLARSETIRKGLGREALETPEVIRIAIERCKQLKAKDGRV